MGIYSKIIDIQKLNQAWDMVKRNKPACGVDNVTYEMFEERRREELRQLNLELAEHRYESLPVRVKNIYKGEKVRKIALFSMRDKVVQQSLAHELGRIYEPLFSESTYAYRPGQSALEALELIEEKTRGHQELWVLKMDIADFLTASGMQICSIFWKIRSESRMFWNWSELFSVQKCLTARPASCMRILQEYIRVPPARRFFQIFILWIMTGKWKRKAASISGIPTIFSSWNSRKKRRKNYMNIPVFIWNREV